MESKRKLSEESPSIDPILKKNKLLELKGNLERNVSMLIDTANTHASNAEKLKLEYDHEITLEKEVRCEIMEEEHNILNIESKLLEVNEEIRQKEEVEEAERKR